MSTVPAVTNEPLLNYAPGSDERKSIVNAIARLRNEMPVFLPLLVGGQSVQSSTTLVQSMPQDHATELCRYDAATAGDVTAAIEAALAVRNEWANLPWNDRAAIFLKAAELISQKYRSRLMAATMLGQGKNVWQAEIDAAAELVDFLRFNVKYAEALYNTQPPENSPGCWNRLEYRPLEGFVYAIAPFNFTAIAGNLVAAPLLMGNVVILKPSPSAVLSNHIIREIFVEAGVPQAAFQLIPGDAEMITKVCLQHREFAALHFTGSTQIFKKLWKQIADNLTSDVYRSYPKIVGETGGKNFHLVHKSAHIMNAVSQSIRAAFEYQGQKCSALSRAYISDTVWKGGFKEAFVRMVDAIKVGPVDEFTNFNGPVIHRAAFDRLKALIESVKSDPALEILAGGKCDDSKGYFIHPTVVQCTDPLHEIFTKEFFGPVLAVYVYEDAKLDEMVKLIDSVSEYALTGAIFGQDRLVISDLARRLVNSAGNFYINEKCTGATVGQQPFGGARLSGTNDKAGSPALLARFVSPRSIKDNFTYLESPDYLSNRA